MYVFNFVYVSNLNMSFNAYININLHRQHLKKIFKEFDFLIYKKVIRKNFFWFAWYFSWLSSNPFMKNHIISYTKRLHCQIMTQNNFKWLQKTSNNTKCTKLPLVAIHGSKWMQVTRNDHVNDPKYHCGLIFK